MPVVAVIGASSDRRKFGNKAVRAFRAQGYTVIPINPDEKEIEGERAYPNVLAYPGPIDEATLYVPSDAGVKVMSDIARKGIGTIWLNPGADGKAVLAKARELGLTPTVGCSILGIGDSPSSY